MSTSVKLKLLLCFIFITANAYCQQPSEIYNRITNELKNYVVDTTPVPDDSLTAAIKKLRVVKGGFNINEAIAYKIAEEKANGKLSGAEAEKAEKYFTGGNGKTLLDNAIIWIYRNKFTMQEIQDLTLFYSTPAGRKISASFPVIMLQAMKAAETISGEAAKKEKGNH